MNELEIARIIRENESMKLYLRNKDSIIVGLVNSAKEVIKERDNLKQTNINLTHTVGIKQDEVDRFSSECITLNKEKDGLMLELLNKDVESKAKDKIIKRLREFNSRGEVQPRINTNGRAVRLLSLTEVTKSVGIKNLTTTIFHDWLIGRGRGEWKVFGNDKRKTFSPNDSFYDLIQEIGYAVAIQVNDRPDKVEVKYYDKIVVELNANPVLRKDLVDYVAAITA